MADAFMDNATYKVMEKLVRSAEGIMLAVRTTNIGFPALCGVDELLRKELGTDYARANNGTWYAGFAVAQLMKEMCYVEAGRANCPSSCVAGEGIVWKA